MLVESYMSWELAVDEKQMGCLHYWLLYTLQKSNITRQDLFPARLQEKAYLLKFPVSLFYNLGAANDHKEHNSLPCPYYY